MAFHVTSSSFQIAPSSSTAGKGAGLARSAGGGGRGLLASQTNKPSLILIRVPSAQLAPLVRI